MIRVELYPGHEHSIERLDGVLPMLGKIAAAVADEARRITISHRVAQEIDSETGEAADGPLGRVNANHWTSWFVEGGTIDQRPNPYLRRALESGAARKVL